MKFQTVRRHALAMEAVTEEPHHDFGSFRVRGRIFATVPPGETLLHVFVGEEDRERTLALHPGCTAKDCCTGRSRSSWSTRAAGCSCSGAAGPNTIPRASGRTPAADIRDPANAPRRRLAAGSTRNSAPTHRCATNSRPGIARRCPTA